MEREKMIEEIARKVCIACGKCKELKGDCYLARNIASVLIDDGDRKIENGTLVELPCKVGDTVYEVEGGRETEGKIIEGKISMLYCTSENRWKIRFVYQLPIYRTKSIHDLYLDTACVSLTKAEAEEKLRELRGEK